MTMRMSAAFFRFVSEKHSITFKSRLGKFAPETMKVWRASFLIFHSVASVGIQIHSSN